MEKEKEDKAKAKESAVGMKEVDAAWMVMLDEFDFEASSEDSPILGPSPCLSLNELLEGFTDDREFLSGIG